MKSKTLLVTKWLLLSIAITLLVSSAIARDDYARSLQAADSEYFEMILEAIDRNDYSTAFELSWRLAERGDSTASASCCRGVRKGFRHS